MTTPIVLSWSGGKDSALALQQLLGDPAWRIVALLTCITNEYERISMHGVRREILHAQAQRLKLPLIAVRLPAQASNAIYESAFSQALDQARALSPDLNTIAFGDLHLADVRAYRERLLGPLNWNAHFPLWGEDTDKLAQRFISDGFRAALCCVDTQQLGAEFCGREFDAHLLADLPPACDPCGENGEFHTCVYACPMWSEPLRLQHGEKQLRNDRFEYVDIKML